MTKKTLGIVLGIIVLLWGVALIVIGVRGMQRAQTKAPSQEDVKTILAESQKTPIMYEDAVSHAQFSYPANWKKQTIQGGALSLTILSGTVNIRFISDDLSHQKKPVTLKQYSDLLMKQGPVEAQKEHVFISPVSDSDVTVDGLPGHEWLYSLSIGSVQGSGKQVWTVKNNRSYVFTYTAANQYFKTFLPIFDALTQTLTIGQ